MIEVNKKMSYSQRTTFSGDFSLDIGDQREETRERGDGSTAPGNNDDDNDDYDDDDDDDDENDEHSTR